MDTTQENNNQTPPIIIPLSNMVCDTRIYLNNAVTFIIKETKIPLYLLDGIISEILADIRRQELMEMRGAHANSGKEGKDDG